MFRFRARAIKGEKYNTKGSHGKLDCRLCLGPPETQEHLQECPGVWNERRGLLLDRGSDNVLAVLRTGQIGKNRPIVDQLRQTFCGQCRPNADQF